MIATAINTKTHKLVYVDSSAYLSVLLGEEGSETVVNALKGASVVSSSLLILEVNRNLVRLTRSGQLSEAQWSQCVTRFGKDKELFSFRDLGMDLCDGFEMPGISTPCTLDLAHLRTALWFHRNDSLSAFVTLGQKQHRAAIELGLPAILP